MIEETRYTETATVVDRPRIATTAAELGAEPEYYRPFLSRIITWGPIWAGVVVAVGVQVVLAVLGIAVGLTVAGQDAVEASAEGMGIAAGIWGVVVALAALFAGGLVAGWLSAPKLPWHGALNGFILWCVVTALSAAIFAVTSGAALGGGLGAMSSVQIGNNATVRMQGTDEGAAPTSTIQTQPEQIARTSAGVAWWTLVVLLLSAGAAATGGAIGHGIYEKRRLALT